MKEKLWLMNQRPYKTIQNIDIAGTILFCHEHQFNFLGLHLNSRLTWNTHMEKKTYY